MKVNEGSRIIVILATVVFVYKLTQRYNYDKFYFFRI